ncbi:hypothetical protein H5407_09325 [Mitsuaria sp. WAJ17]|uniref:hypothetical protein n=1 Tax=Mitsuaria sp. WAJ17 TaxID=2761452 RepID=UPI0016009978|nr:hypothetical protein [Mitsuaria sp. WAJ17]MBB2485427.1 hypothetical protein [Mitsuaria sp. WAJ17]
MNETLKQLSELEIEAVSGGETAASATLLPPQTISKFALVAPEAQPDATPGPTPGPLPTM